MFGLAPVCCKLLAGTEVPGLRGHLKAEADLLLCWSKTHYEPSHELLHLRMLRAPPALHPERLGWSERTFVAYRAES